MIERRNGSNAQPTRTVGETFNTWLQALAILFAGAWGIWIFYHKEIRVPRAEVGTVSGKAELKLVGTKEPFRAVATWIHLKNDSKKSVRLLPGLVQAIGYRFMNNLQRTSIENIPAEVMPGPNRLPIAAFDAAKDPTVLMACDPLRNAELGPGEERDNTILFHLDSRCCDFIDLAVYVPFVYNDLDLGAGWEIVKGDAHETLYRLDEHGQSKELSPLKPADNEWLAKHPYYTLRLRYMLSLWRVEDERK